MISHTFNSPYVLKLYEVEGDDLTSLHENLASDTDETDDDNTNNNKTKGIDDIPSRYPILKSSSKPKNKKEFVLKV